MTQDNNFNTITSPKEAIEQFAGERFIEWSMQYIAQEISSWKSVESFRTGSFRPERVKKFLIQRFLALEGFWGGRENEPGLVGFALSNLSETGDPMAENVLELITQKKNADEPRVAWQKLLMSCGVTTEELKRAESKEVTREYLASLSDIYSTAEWQTVAGAFAASERIRALESEVVAALIRRNLSTEEKDLQSFISSMDARSEAGLAAGHILDKAVLDAPSRSLAWEGIVRQLEGTREFLEEMAKYLQSPSN